MVSLEKINEAFRIALDLPEDFEITDESAFNEVPGWDSVGHMRLVLELETIVGGPLELEEIVDLDTVQKIRLLVASKLDQP